MIATELSTAIDEATKMICVLRVGGALFSVEADRICEVLGEMASKAVPLAPRYICGMVPYRGEVLTTISLRVLLNLEETRNTNFVLVLNDDEADERFGLVVDAIEGLMTIAHDAMESNPSSLDARSVYLFDGLYRTNSTLMVHLNAQHLRPSRISQSGLFDPGNHEKSRWVQ